MLKQLLIVGLGGASGSILRYLVTVLTKKFYWGLFPVATFAANITGCFLIGLFAGLLGGQLSINPKLKLLLITGFCGGYTTFSAFAFENLHLLQGNNYMVALLYTVLTVVIGVIAVWAGMQLSLS